MTTTTRRDLLKAGAALSALATLGLGACATTGAPSKARVLVVGGGYGGATTAKYVRLLSQQQIEVVLVEPLASFVSCPISNLVIGGSRTMADITRPYDALQSKHGVRVVRDTVASIDTAKKTATLASGPTIAYDKLVLSPGIDLMFDSIEGLRAAQADGRILQAWKAGPETAALRAQLEAMPDGGTYAIVVPEAPYRCPPGPYERASQVASYFKQAKPRSKVLILDANPDITSKGALFRKAWSTLYPGMVEFRGTHKALAVDAKTNTVKFDVQEDVRADVLNVLPPMRAGRVAVDAGLASVKDAQGNARWCGVNYLNFESTATKDVHVIGDAMQLAPGMPKSGHMANSQGKVLAAALVAELNGWPVNTAPMLTNTCYSFVNDKLVVHVASVHNYVAADKTFKPVPGSGGVSSEQSEVEGVYAWNWARTIWADSLA